MATFNVIQEGPVNALALNKDYTQVAIGGRNGKIKHVKFVSIILSFFSI